MAEPIRVDLDGALKGQHVLLDADEMNMGLIEDIGGSSLKVQMDAIARCIVGGNLVGVKGGAVFSIDNTAEGKTLVRQGLRKLKPLEMQALVEGIAGALELPKAS